jgi:Domain of unknown function (DUF4145)
MAGINRDLYLSAECQGHLPSSDPASWTTAACGNCGADQMIVVGITNSAVPNDGYMKPHVQWLRCIRCFHGVVVNGEQISPAVMPLDNPDGVPKDDLAAWQEVRGCLSVGAHTAAVMMCRKLLFHVAVAHGLSEKNEKDKAPTFAEALNHLESEGVFTKSMRPWVARIKDVGNEANHELSGVTQAQALDIAKFTQYLMKLAYELPAMMNDAPLSSAGPTQ